MMKKFIKKSILINGIFLVCSKVCSEQFAFIGFYGVLLGYLK